MEIPEIGSRLTVDQANLVLKLIRERQVIFMEPIDNSIMSVLFGVGERFTEVYCIHGEWSGRKQDIKVRRGDIPKCPNGHVLLEKPPHCRLGWVEGEFHARPANPQPQHDR